MGLHQSDDPGGRATRQVGLSDREGDNAMNLREKSEYKMGQDIIIKIVIKNPPQDPPRVITHQHRFLDSIETMIQIIKDSLGIFK